MIKIYYKKTDERACDNALLSNVILSEQRKEKALALRNINDKRLSVAASLLLQEAITEWTGCAQEPFYFAYDGNGKPMLPAAYTKSLHWGGKRTGNPERDIYVNLSHSGDYVACVIGDEPVGIDIQKWRGYKEAVSERYFHIKELEKLSAVPTEDRERLFYFIWARKEAYIKYTGLGMRQNLNLFNVFDESEYSYEDVTDIEGYALSAICKK